MAGLHGQMTATVSRSDYDFSMEGDRVTDKRTEYGFFAIYGTADLRWKRKYMHGDTATQPTVALGILQNLRDGHVDSGFTFASNRYTASLTEDRTTGTVDAGIRFTRNNTSGAIHYNGEYGSHFRDHIVWAEFGMTF